MARLAFFAAFAAVALSPEPAPAAAQTAPDTRDWHAATRDDIEAAYKIFRQSHPGMFDPNNPGFLARLDAARAAALAFAETVHDPAGHRRALAIFSAGLRDGHAQVYSTARGGAEAQWPGFFTVWRGNALFVYESEEAAAPRGTEILRCDGKPLREAIEATVFRIGGRPDEAGQWMQNAPMLFLQNSLYPDRPKACEIRGPDGGMRQLALTWRKAPSTVGTSIWNAMEGDANPIALTEPASGIFHIGLSDFAPGPDGVKAYDELYAELDRRADELAHARAIVLDLRHNNGGSSHWSHHIAEKLWGEAAVKYASDSYFRGVEVWWLADPGNVARFEADKEKLRSSGNTESLAFVEKTTRNLDAAIQRGDRFYIERDDPKEALAPRVAPRSMPPVYVAVAGPCASACLDAVDLFKQFPDVRLIGSPTSGDSAYLEVVQDALPSGVARIVIPSKIWVERPRASGAFYTPDIAVDDLEWSQAVFIRYVEKDLAR